MPAAHWTLRGAFPLPGSSPPETSPLGAPLPSAASACHTPIARPARSGKPRAPGPAPPPRPQALRNRQAGRVRAPPPFETPVNLPHVVGNIGRFLSHRRSSLPVGRKTDVSSLDQVESRRPAEGTRELSA